MYLLVADDVPLGFQINSVTHTSLLVHLKFQDHPEYKEWLENSFRKVTCKVTREQFEYAKQFEDHVVFTEEDIGGTEVVIGFRPRKEWDVWFRTLQLFGKD